VKFDYNTNIFGNNKVRIKSNFKNTVDILKKKCT